MKLVSVNVGLPRSVEWNGQTVTTGIFKEPVEGRVWLRALNLDGDRQADLSVHGGPDKAVYAYPAEHYPYWREELPGRQLPWGMFGENLTSDGLLEESVHVGDRFRIGSAELMVTQPRLPCYKLGLKFGREDMVKRFLASRRTGFYFRVVQEGAVEAGDVIEVAGREPQSISVAAVTRLYVRESRDSELLRRALELEALPAGWRNHFRKLLEKK